MLSSFFKVKKRTHCSFTFFFEFLATYETQKNDAFFSKERKRMQRVLRSFQKNVKERKERCVLLQRT